MSLTSEIFCAAIETADRALNTIVRLDPETGQALGGLHGKVIAIDIDGTGLRVYCLPGPDGLTLLSQYAGNPDTVIRGTPLALLQLATQPDASDMLLTGKIDISGDIELGQRFKRILNRMQIDWEEWLSKLTGDVFAHKLGHTLRQAWQWQQQARERLHQDGIEYLRYELNQIPTRDAVEHFSQTVETLRDDVARLAARVAQLTSRTSS